MIRKILFWSHLTLGLLAALPLLVMALTGALIAFEPQLVAWSESDRRTVAIPPVGQKLSLDSLAAVARSARPGKLTALSVGDSPDRSAVASFGREGSLYLDPWSGKVLGSESEMRKALRFMEEIHRWLGSREIGRPVTGTAALLCLFLSLSGLWLWWPRSLRAARNVLWPRKGLTGRARDWQWHNAFGILSWPCLVALSLTGSVMSWPWAEALLFRSVGSQPPRREAGTREKQARAPGGERDGKRQAKGSMISFQTAFDTASARMRSPWETMTLRQPQKPGEPVQVQVRTSGSGGPPPLTIRIDARSGAVVGIERPSQDAGSRLRRLIKPLHTGELFGIAGQVAMFLASLACAMLVWTGASLSWRRLRRSRSAAA